MSNNQSDKAQTKKIEFRRNVRKSNVKQAFTNYEKNVNKLQNESGVSTEENNKNEIYKFDSNKTVKPSFYDKNFERNAKRTESKEKDFDLHSNKGNSRAYDNKGDYKEVKNEYKPQDYKVEHKSINDNTVSENKNDSSVGSCTKTDNNWTYTQEKVDYEVYTYKFEKEKHKTNDSWSSRGFMNKTYDESSHEEDIYRADRYMKRDITKQATNESNIDLKAVDCDYNITPLLSFTDLNLSRGMKAYLSELTPTLVQKYAIPAILENKNVLVRAPTGLGKTLSFLVPLVLKLSKTDKPKLRILIVTPTRELAQQIKVQLDKLIELDTELPFKSIALIGGKSGSYTKPLLAKGCDILIATPGRLCDYVDQGILTLKNVRYFVLDEADRMLEMGFENEMRYIRNKLTNSHNKETDNRDDTKPLVRTKFLMTYMFSATFDRKLSFVVDDYLTKDRINIKFEKETIKNIKQEFKFLNSDFEKRKELFETIKLYKDKKILVFVDTKSNCRNIETHLNAKDCKTVSLHGDKEQAEREYAFNKFINGTSNILVATSVASRGLDIPDVFLVINYNMPNDVKEYIHRIGRSGRAGKKGYAISFFSNNNFIMKNEIVEILKESENEIPNEFKNESVRLINRNDHKTRSNNYKNETNDNRKDYNRSTNKISNNKQRQEEYKSINNKIEEVIVKVESVSIKQEYEESDDDEALSSSSTNAWDKI